MSSSSCGCAGFAGTVPKIAVALDGSPVADSLLPGTSGSSNGDLEESIQGHRDFRNYGVVLETQTTSHLLDSKGAATYDAHTTWPQQIQALETR